MTLQSQMYVVVRGKDSIIDLPLLEDGRLVPSVGVTRCDLVFKQEGVADLTLSSSTSPTWFDLNNEQSVDGLTLGVVRINLRQIPTPPTDGRYKVEVFFWDAVFTNGRYWATIDVEVRAAPAPPVP